MIEDGSNSMRIALILGVVLLFASAARTAPSIPGGQERRRIRPHLVARWEPDRIRIQAAEGSNTDIFVMNADGGRIRRLVGTKRRDGRPDWSPDAWGEVRDDGIDRRRGAVRRPDPTT